MCARLQGHITDFQRIPDKPSGDGGLDGLSHGQECAYCCYGPEQDPVKEFIDAHHVDPKPFVWTKTADEILASIARFAQRTADAQAATTYFANH